MALPDTPCTYQPTKQVTSNLSPGAPKPMSQGLHIPEPQHQMLISCCAAYPLCLPALSAPYLSPPAPDVCQLVV